MLYYLYIIGLILIKVLPLRALYALAGFIARLYCACSRQDKEAIRDNLGVILGGGATKAEIDSHVQSIFRNFAKYLVDFFKVRKLSRKEIDRFVKIEGIESVDKCLAEGKGAVLLSIHIGNWEMGGAVIGALGYPVNALVLEHGDKRINDLFVKQRVANGLKVIPVGIQVKQCFRALKNNELLAIVGDKDYTSNGEYIDFFGKKAFIPRGPAVLSLRTGAPIVICALTRERDNTFKFKFEDPIRYVPSGDREKDVKAFMGMYIKVFEKYIRKYPDQWYAFRRIWEQEPIIL